MRISDLMERPSSRDLLSDWYAAALADQAESGISIAEYADEIGVSAATLYQWRRRLSAQEVKPLVELSPAPELVEVILADGQATIPPRSSLTVQLGADRAIHVSPHFDASALQRLIRTLESC